VDPLIAKIEGVLELRAKLHAAGNPRGGNVNRTPYRPADRGRQLSTGLPVSNDTRVGQREHRQMRPVPPGERGIDRIGKLIERVRRINRKHPPRPRPQFLTTPAKQLARH
jgi:hypothetical protein